MLPLSFIDLSHGKVNVAKMLVLKIKNLFAQFRGDGRPANGRLSSRQECPIQKYTYLVMWPLLVVDKRCQIYKKGLVVGWLDDGSINQSLCTIIAFGRWRFYTIDYFKRHLQNYKTTVIHTFYINYYHSRRKHLTFGQSLNIFHLFTFSAILSVHTKLRIRPGFLTAMWILPDFYWREKINYASMIGR